MLKLYETIPGTNVMSLRTGAPVGNILKPLINPNNLYIEGWHTQDNQNREHLILLSNDIREIIQQGFVVNDHDVLTSPGELIRLKDLLKLDFQLQGLKVSSESGRSYGKVSDYAFESDNFYIQKIYVSQPIVKNFSGGTLSIDRSQIVEVTNRRIVIEDPTEESTARAASPVIG